MDEEATNSGFSVKRLLLIDWLSTPKSKRKPKTLGQFADSIGFTDDTMRNWMREDGFQDAVKQAIQEKSCYEDDAEIIAALVKSAKSPSMRGAVDRKTYLQWRGLLVEKQEVKQDGNITVTVNYIDPINKPA